jgi:hypothetical protein
VDGNAPQARRFVVGDRVRVRLEDRISDGTVRAVITGKDGFQLKVDLGFGKTVVVESWQVLKY